MTRINLIPVSELTDQHLLAEHREIKRIPNLILSGKFSLEWQPKEFTLGQGHIKFFYDKILFLSQRYIRLYDECIKRWFKVEYYIKPFKDLYMSDLSNDWSPTEKDIEVSYQRIQEKIKAKPNFYKYYWQPIINYWFYFLK